MKGGALARIWKELHHDAEGGACDCERCQALILVLRVAEAAERWEVSRLSRVDPAVHEYGAALEAHRQRREELKAAVVKMRETAIQEWIDGIQPIEEL